MSEQNQAEALWRWLRGLALENLPTLQVLDISWFTDSMRAGWPVPVEARHHIQVTALLPPVILYISIITRHARYQGQMWVFGVQIYSDITRFKYTAIRVSPLSCLSVSSRRVLPVSPLSCLYLLDVFYLSHPSPVCLYLLDVSYLSHPPPVCVLQVSPMRRVKLIHLCVALPRSGGRGYGPLPLTDSPHALCVCP